MCDERPDWWPRPSSPAASRVMEANYRRDTSPELAVRRDLHSRGMRYRVDHTIRYDGTWTKPDIVFTKQKVAVYIDGCFWHGCPQHYQSPRSNRRYWSSKIVRNRTRDRRATRALTRDGWRVLRFWEHQDPAVVADVIQVVTGARA